MSFKLSPPVPPNIPEDKVYSINDFNEYFEQLQNIASSHDDSIAGLVTEIAKCLPFFLNPVTINTNLSNGVYYITSNIQGTFPAGVTGVNSFLFSVVNGSTSTQFLFDFSGIYSRRGTVSEWRNISGASVIDDLTSTSSFDSLSANQGRILNEKKIDYFKHDSEDEVNIDENLEDGVHVFIDTQVSGTFPDFMSILPGANKFIIESYGVTNEIVHQMIADSSTIGTRSGYTDRDALGNRFWVWADWQQIVTAENVTQLVNEALENLTIDCGEF